MTEQEKKLSEYSRILKEYREISGGRGMTKIREVVLELHEEYRKDHDTPPTYQWVADKMGLSRQRVHLITKWLVANDYLQLPPPPKPRIKKPIKKIIW